MWHNEKVVKKMLTSRPTVRDADLCWALGGIICNFIPILPYFQHWGGRTSTAIFLGPQIKWRPKKKLFHQRWKTFFFPISNEDQRSDADQSQIIGGVYPSISP